MSRDVATVESLLHDIVVELRELNAVQISLIVGELRELNAAQISLRDRFAMTMLLARGWEALDEAPAVAIRWAYDIADKMIKMRSSERAR